MVIDRSDTSEWAIPHTAVRMHDSQKGKKMGCKVYGVIVHGHFAACYVLNSHLPGGTNVTIECLHRTFLKLRSQGKKFPKRLNIQLDNTSKDNKSRFVVAYLYMLVCCGCFDEIDVFFLKLVIRIAMQTNFFLDLQFISETKISGTLICSVTTS